MGDLSALATAPRSLLSVQHEHSSHSGFRSAHASLRPSIPNCLNRRTTESLSTSGTRKRAAVAAAVNPDGNGARNRPALPSSAVTYSAGISTDLPLDEPPWASFDEYLEDRQRVFSAMFPDKRRSQRLNDEEWRINMLPIKFLLVTAYPIIDMRLRLRSPSSMASPFRVHPGIARVLELQATRWELQGLDGAYKPPHFELNVQGMLYSFRSQAGGSRLKGHLQMSISFVLPPVLTLIPEEVLRTIAESVLKGLVERMKQEVDVSLLKDYRDFRRGKLMQQKMKAMHRQPAVVRFKGDHVHE